MKVSKSSLFEAFKICEKIGPIEIANLGASIEAMKMILGSRLFNIERTTGYRHTLEVEAVNTIKNEKIFMWLEDLKDYNAKQCIILGNKVIRSDAFSYAMVLDEKSRVQSMVFYGLEEEDRITFIMVDADGNIIDSIIKDKDYRYTMENFAKEVIQKEFNKKEHKYERYKQTNEGLFISKHFRGWYKDIRDGKYRIIKIGGMSGSTEGKPYSMIVDTKTDEILYGIYGDIRDCGIRHPWLDGLYLMSYTRNLRDSDVLLDLKGDEPIRLLDTYKYIRIDSRGFIKAMYGAVERENEYKFSSSTRELKKRTYSLLEAADEDNGCTESKKGNWGRK